MFDRYEAIQDRVLGKQYLAHSAATDQILDLVTPANHRGSLQLCWIFPQPAATLLKATFPERIAAEVHRPTPGCRRRFRRWRA